MLRHHWRSRAPVGGSRQQPQPWRRHNNGPRKDGMLFVWAFSPPMVSNHLNMIRAGSASKTMSQPASVLLLTVTDREPYFYPLPGEVLLSKSTSTY